MIYAFKRRRVVQGCFAFFALSIVVYVVGVSWFFVAGDAWPVKFLLTASALAFVAYASRHFADTFSPGPILTISIEGIRFCRFLAKPLRGRTVREVMLTRGYSRCTPPSVFQCRRAACGRTRSPSASCL